MEILKRLRLTNGYGISGLGLSLIGLVLILACGFAVYFAVQHDTKACEAAGGKLVANTSTGVGTVVGSNGKVGTGVITTTSYTCVMPS